MRAARSAAAERGGRLVAIALVAATAGCRARPPATAWEPGREHAAPTAPDAAVPPPADRSRAELARAARDGDPRRIAVWANRLAAAGEAWPEDVDVAAAVDALDAGALEAVWSQIDPGHPPADRVALRLALLARHRGDDGAAAEWARRVAPDSPIAGRARALARDIAARARDDGVLAVALPLSGPHAAVGRELRAGIDLAAADGARVAYVDTEGTEAGAIAAVDRAVYDVAATAMLGPVGRRAAAAAARRAVQLGLPIALMAPASAGAAPEVGVFRLWPSGEAIAAAAAREAVRRGFDRVAAFAPRDEDGIAQARAFAAAARRAGARVVAEATYDPSGANLEADVKVLLGLDPTTNARLRRHLRDDPKTGWKTFSPDVPFDLLFIPDTYERAALAVAYLPYFNVELRTTARVDPAELRRKHGGRIPSLVQLMGSAGWHHPGMLARGGALVEGALVVDVCAGGADEAFATEGAAAFFDEFVRRHGRPPSRAAAQAYDAARLMLSALRDGGDRAGVAAALRRAPRVDGACGSAEVGRSGEIVRDVVVLRIDGGEFTVDGD
ncbi:MAG: hypothetical protein D6689_12020 [Deltaproteobacteria bacterium]|nr:MAG: hypothetical protein D6689_12020 [Deltaproteobacteria bacterium]